MSAVYVTVLKHANTEIHMMTYVVQRGKTAFIVHSIDLFLM